MTAPPNIARRTIGLRPTRSATAPHTGEASIIVTACALNTAPARNTRLSPQSLPNDVT